MSAEKDKAGIAKAKELAEMANKANDDAAAKLAAGQRGGVAKVTRKELKQIRQGKTPRGKK